MKFVNKIELFFFLLTSTIVLGQTPGFNYQALILNNEEIQIPGTDVTTKNLPLDLEDITLRFTITNDAGIEYTEEHDIRTDENGMVSIIVGEGTPINFTFENINWDGKLKYLNVELNIISNNEGFVFLDSQKILYIPHQNNGTGTIKIVNSLRELNPPYSKGTLIWITSFGANKNPTLLIWDDFNWVPVNEDYDDANELGLIVVANDIARSTKFKTPVIGNQVWNKTLKCIQVFDGSNWVSITTKALNGLHKDGNTIKLGGHLIEPTELTTDQTNTLSIKGLQESVNKEDLIVVVDKNTGVLRQKPLLMLSQQKQVIIIATDGQLEFPIPLSITNTENIDVYRNGVLINFTAVNNSTIKLEPEAICYKNDKIRIVQLY
ncbi:hypothetical protein [Polaribacter sp. SA4-12]|uniref:hypothetical protein n=1 Tax=Polaribacter sp. SA4-12 TaxID=1312072 RepID=UPI0012FCF991|nr:hypothetical protein [Polaribacter sp. SA4-12]